MRRLVNALLLLTLSPEARAQEELLDEIYGKFSSVTGASADFTEIKKTKAFKKEQVQKGKFSSSRKGDLVWEIIEPVRSTFTVKGDTARVTYPDMETPEQAVLFGQTLRQICRLRLVRQDRSSLEYSSPPARDAAQGPGAGCRLVL